MAAITSNTESWNGHTFSEVEAHIKSRFNVELHPPTGVTLNKSTLSLYEGRSEGTLIATVSPMNANNKNVTWSSSNSSIATVDTNGKITAVKTGTCIITVTSVEGGYTAQCTTTVLTTYNGHSYVDLGLPSGTKWATMNVGASSPTDYGNYYQWGKGARQYPETSGESIVYIESYTNLPTSADTASQVWGGLWHMPTQNQIGELLQNVTSVWGTSGGHNGCTITSRINGNSIFIPASGYYYNGTLTDLGGYTEYFSNYLSGNNVPVISVDSNGLDIWYGRGNRAWGAPVRPVVDF